MRIAEVLLVTQVLLGAISTVGLGVCHASSLLES